MTTEAPFVPMACNSLRQHCPATLSAVMEMCYDHPTQVLLATHDYCSFMKWTDTSQEFSNL